MITRSTRIVQLHNGHWVGKRGLLKTVRGIVASRAYQSQGRDGLKPSTLATLDRALWLIGALDAAVAETSPAID